MHDSFDIERFSAKFKLSAEPGKPKIIQLPTVANDGEQREYHAPGGQRKPAFPLVNREDSLEPEPNQSAVNLNALDAPRNVKSQRLRREPVEPVELVEPVAEDDTAAGAYDGGNVHALTGEAAPPISTTSDARERTVEINLVSGRKMRKIRETAIVVYWFSSWAPYRISHPPQLPQSYGLQQFDIFLHAYSQNDYQAWRCESTDPQGWSPLSVGQEYSLPGQKKSRAFVVTEGGQPSWVLPDTVERAYKRLRRQA